MRTLIIDNYDSFTFNLFQMLATINGVEPIVVHNDQLPWEELAGLAFDNIVISPGPGTPEHPDDCGVSLPAVLSGVAPVLGVCLGHQCIGYAFGGRILHAPEPMHGRLSTIEHDGSDLWTGIPRRFEVVRYHSLIVDAALPGRLHGTAWTDEGVLMAMRHQSLPLFGVQFHPESICTEHGERLLTNFRDLSRRHLRTSQVVVPESVRYSIVPHAEQEISRSGYRVVHRRIEARVDPALVFDRVFRGDPFSFWLDSSRAEPGTSRFSFVGSATGPNSVVVSYDVETGEVTERRGGRVRTSKESIYAYLDRELRVQACSNPELPFDFNCGFVGYFGYELKAEVGAKHRHKCPYPDATFVLADRMVAFDHQEGAVYLLCLLAPQEDERPAHAWFAETERWLATSGAQPARPMPASQAQVAFELGRSHERYLQDIERCKAYIRDGETYEVCLTNQIHTTVPDPFATYLTLRRDNPAPYAAFLSFGEVTVLSSSPERFLRVDRNGWAESKPMKGTRPRGRTPEEDARIREELATCVKDRSENLMIVDLVRNDLGRVCEVGSVHVPGLMQVETYQTVHQLVSTVRGRIRRDLGAVDCVKHAFPGGSMTGAPKLRTMNIIDELEEAPRGVYSGAIGFLGLNGTADLSIVIRTAVVTPRSATIGVGGAIVILSDAEAEFEETMLKARALMNAVRATSAGG